MRARVSREEGREPSPCPRDRAHPAQRPSARADRRATGHSRTSARQHPARGRSQQEIDALVTEHLPLAAFAVNAVAARISLPGHVSREDLLSCAHVALVEVAKRFDPSRRRLLRHLCPGPAAGRGPRRAALRRLGQPLGPRRRPAHRRRRRRADHVASAGRRPARSSPPASASPAASSTACRSTSTGPSWSASTPRPAPTARRWTCPTPASPPSARCCAASGPATCTKRSARCPTGSTRSSSAISSVTNRSPTSPTTSASPCRASRRCAHGR